MHFDESFLKQALPEALLLNGTFSLENTISIDTRTLKEGDVFFALPGENVDGHDFIPQALSSKASGIIISHAKKDIIRLCTPEQLERCFIVAVPDTMAALITLASCWRKCFEYPVVAITGSVGKTSTKELIARMVTTHGLKSIISLENQNTQLGVALTILRMRAHHDVAIFEVGINKVGEMAKIASVLRPSIAVITNIGHCHMEGLGSLSGISIEKRDLFKYFTDKNIGIINGDQKLLSSVGYSHPVVKFGNKTMNQVQARKISRSSDGISFFLRIYKEKFYVHIDSVHEGVVNNSLAACAVAYLLDIPTGAMVEAIQNPVVVPGRFEKRPLRSNKGIVISDCYNANPESMKAALLAFQKIETSAQKIVVLGDMLELGSDSPFWHRQLGRFLRKVPSVHHVILVGTMVQWTRKAIPVGTKVDMVPNWQEAIGELQKQLDKDSLVLIKGSNGVGLKNVVAAIVEK